MFRTQGSDFGFPYELRGKEVSRTKHKVKDMFWQGQHPKQKYPVSWLIKKFWPVNGWTEENLQKLLDSEASLPDLRAKELGILSVVPFVPLPMTDHTTSMSFDSIGEKMPIPAMSLSELSGSSTITNENIVSIGGES
jgi:hypothetical protein